MKKSLLTFVFLLALTALNAQTLIKAKFQKGEQATYSTVTEAKLSTPMGGGDQSVKTSSNTVITVKEANADGYVIELKTKDINTEGDQSTALQTQTIVSQYFGNVPMRIKTDANGKVTDILNFEEVQASVSKLVMAFIDSIYKAKPQLEQSLPKYKMAMSLNNMLTKQTFIEIMEHSTFFNLFGKTLKTGDKEDVNQQGIKSIVTYEVTKEPNELVIIGKTQNNMSEDDVKSFLIDKMKLMGSDESMIAKFEQGWLMMKKMGLTKMDGSGTITTRLLPSGWATEYSSSIKSKVMGAVMTTNSVSKLVEHSWK